MENIKEEIENKIIDCINSGIAGRLIIFKPEKNNFGADLSVQRRGKYKEKEIYFQINSFVAPAEAVNFVKEFPQESFKADKNFYLLFVYFNEVTQKMSDYVWLIPSLQLQDIIQVIKSVDGKNILRFEVPLDVKQKNQYSKFLINTNDLGKTIFRAMEKGGKFDFKNTEFEEKKIINIENLKDFLCNARRDTYASSSTSLDNPRLLESKQFEFQKADYFYRDIYFVGDKKFIGQEIIYLDSKPVWGMNYMGDQIEKIETAFLKESLSKLAEKCRIGGTCEYEKREYKYQDQGQGNLEKFSGKEEIFVDNKSIYKLNYEGGLI